MKLQEPTDFLILGTLMAGWTVAPNMAMEAGKSRPRVNVRLPVLADYWLVEKIVPAEDFGLYELFDCGLAVLELREEYDTTDEFEEQVDEFVEEITE